MTASGSRTSSVPGRRSRNRHSPVSAASAIPRGRRSLAGTPRAAAAEAAAGAAVEAAAGGPPSRPGPRRPQGRGQQGRSGQGRSEAEGAASAPPAPRPGLTSATFAGGYTLSFWIGDVATGDAKEFWHNAADEKLFNGIGQIAFRHGDHVVFQLEPEEWTRFYSVAVPGMTGALHNTGPNDHTDMFGPGFTDVPQPPQPFSLTPQDGQIETFDFSEDGKYLYYGT